MPNTWTEASMAIEKMQHLKNGWNGKGSLAPSKKAVQVAMMLARFMAKAKMLVPDFVAATTDGGVYLEWMQVEGYMEIEILNSGETKIRLAPRVTTP